MSAPRWSRLRPEAVRALRILSDLMEDAESEPERTLAAYLDAKARLAHAFQALALEQLSNPEEQFHRAVAAIESQMRVSYDGVVPESLLAVRGFGTVHRQLFAYLSRRVGTAVSAGELRVITADAVHTERRVRELRDLGFDVVATHASGSDTYELKSSHPDVNQGALQLVRRNIKESRALDAETRGQLLHAIGCETDL